MILYKVDFESGIAEQKASIDSHITQYAHCNLKGYVYIMGGLDNDLLESNICYRYNIADDKWELFGHLP